MDVCLIVGSLFSDTSDDWKVENQMRSRGYDGIIDGSDTPPDEKEVIEILADDKGEVLQTKKDKLEARTANKKGYRDLVMYSEGISLNIVENATSDKLTKGDLKRHGEDLNKGGIQKQWKIKLRFTQNSSITRQRPMDWLTFMEKK